MESSIRKIKTDRELTILFGREYVASEAFRSLFRDGMRLIELASIYLDGEGRDEAQHLPRLEALEYANESMRLTNRLMQVASWLLLHRALADGEISTDELNRQRAKIRIVPIDTSTSKDIYSQLPEKMQRLIIASLRLQSRIIHLDSFFDQENEKHRNTGRNAVALQHMLLSSAFEKAQN
ncbi:MAG: DUF1465 family protein [Hyphomicrobiales bacterium]